MLNEILSHYRIVERLGGGGMGVVYRAHDMRLDREVALKVLPDDVRADYASILRFGYEARAAAALNHPNICTVHEVGDISGVPYISLELLEGATLKDRIGGTPIALDLLLDWALQISDGLGSAHSHGIIHRDIKPANLFITTRNQAKILDFGLAKLHEAQQSEPENEVDRTVVALKTDLGQTIGTPAYMSPEQTRAEQLDARSDLFSLGVVLYEMASGQRPFEGENAATVNAAILRDEPLHLRSLNPHVPEELARIIRKALEKDRDLRYQTAADLRSDLKRLQRDLESSPATLPVIAAPKSPGLSRLSLWRGVLLGALLTLVLLAVGALLAQPVPVPKLTSITRVTNDHRSKIPPFLSDGSRLYFNTGLEPGTSPYQVSQSGGESVPFPVELGLSWVLDISEDRSKLLVGSYGSNPYGQASLWVVPVLGGSPWRMGDVKVDGQAVAGAAWSPDGQSVVFADLHTLKIATDNGRRIHKLVDLPARPSYIRWSPDGRTIRFTLESFSSGTDSSEDSYAIWEAPPGGGTPHRFLPDFKASHCCGSWTPDGRYFVFESVVLGSTGAPSTIWAWSEKSGLFRKIRPNPFELTTGPGDSSSPAFSPDGKQIFVGVSQSMLEITRYDAQSHQWVPFLNGRSAEGLDFTRDGKWVTYVSYPDLTLWRSTVEGDHRLQLSEPGMLTSMPRWSPDGKRIVFQAHHQGEQDRIFAVNSEGGSPSLLVKQDAVGDATWSNDGQQIAFSVYPPPQNDFSSQRVAYVKLLDVATGNISTVPGSRDLWSPRWSPNGRYLSALSSDTLHLLLFDFHTSKWTELTKAVFGYPSWSSDSRYIYYDTVELQRRFFRINVETRRIEEVADLRTIELGKGDHGCWTGLAPDDSPLVVRDASLQDMYALEWDAH